jgi:hypothetical protein
MLLPRYQLPSKPRLFEAFSGIGCQRMAFDRLGIDYEMVGISEIDKYAINSYMAIHGDTKNYGSICDIKGKDLPEIDVFTYSFPSDTAQKQNAIQAYGSTITYSQRYMLGVLFGIAFDDEDPDHEKNFKKEVKTFEPKQAQKTNDKISPADAKYIYKIAMNNNYSSDDFVATLKKYGYNHSTEILSKDLDKIKKEFENVLLF